MTDKLALFILAMVSAGLVVLTGWAIRRLRISPRERERRRRSSITLQGRITDGNVTEASPETIFYSYSVAGVGYATSQEVADLLDVIPATPEEYVGCTVSVKYLNRNPANSIVVSEEWSGLRLGKPKKPHQRVIHTGDPGPLT